MNKELEKIFDKSDLAKYDNAKDIKNFISYLLSLREQEIENINFYDWNEETQRMIKDKIISKLK